MREIYSVIGNDLASKFLYHFGGQQVRFPKRIYLEHPIALVIGLPAAISLSRYFAGETVSVPRGQKTTMCQRNEVIRLDRLGGMSINHLAQKYQLTSRRIHAILSGK